MRTPLSIALSFAMLGTAPVMLTSCGASPEEGSMEARAERTLQEFETTRDAASEELLELRNELDQKLLKVEAGLADVELTEEEIAAHEELRAEINAQHQRVEIVLSEVRDASIDTWAGIRADVERTTTEVGQWIDQHADVVLETVEEATQPLEGEEQEEERQEDY
jgi:ElaB/YqjD/DUF883 family membrane-anchored ribosome-binding protein